MRDDKAIIIGFSRAKDWTAGWPLSRLIRAFMGTEYSHVYLKFYLAGEPLIFEARLGGVGFTTVQNFKKSSETVDAFFLVNSNEKIKEVRNTCAKQAGVPYGFTQLLGFPFKKLRHLVFGDKHTNNVVSNGLGRQICSETVAYILQKHWDHEFKTNLDSITPKDIYETLITESDKFHRKSIK